jgi:hypothetical protein
MLLATARQMNTPSFAHSLSSSAYSACPGKGSDQGRAEGSEPSRTSASSRFPNPIPVSNRELSLLERELSYCKQRKANLSNRELSTILSSAAPRGAATGNRETARGNVGLWPTTTFAAVFAAPKGASPEKFSACPNLNRQIHEFRKAVTYRKQTMAHCSNSQKNQKWMCAFSPVFPPTRISSRTNAPTENGL